MNDGIGSVSIIRVLVKANLHGATAEFVGADRGVICEGAPGIVDGFRGIRGDAAFDVEVFGGIGEIITYILIEIGKGGGVEFCAYRAKNLGFYDLSACTM